LDSQQPLIDRQFLEKLERLTIHWRKSFPGLVGGHNISRYAGPGQEFLDHRHFHQGDDLRSVNWRAYMRLDKLFLKMFQIEPRVPVRLLLDISKSMTTGDINKFDYARRLAAAICYVGMVRLDTIVVHPFSSNLGQAHICSGGRHRFGGAADFLSALEPEGETSFMQVARQFAGRYAQRGLFIVISDFLADEDCEKPFDYIAEFGHELFLVQVWADEDREPPWEGELDLRNAESGAKQELSFDAASKRKYTEAFDEWSDRIQRVALRHGGRYTGVSTSTPIEEAVFSAIATAQGAS
jgi:uncharacterized protein (DUF58 family)